MADPVVLPYSKSWVDSFEAEAGRLRDCIEPWLVGPIEHIGSTAIPGMIAKPQIDMMAPVREPADAEAAARSMGALGYVERPHRRDAVLVVRGAGVAWDLDSTGTHSLHLTTIDSELWTERLLFRDTLRANGLLRTQYAALKQQMLAAEAPYASASKREFVREVLAGRKYVMRDDLKVGHGARTDLTHE